MADQLETWSGSLHQTFRLLPTQADHMRPFLDGDGLTKAQVLSNLPYDKARAGSSAGSTPDARRYRDGKQLYETAGLLFEKDDHVHVTVLGKATLRWLDLITESNASVLAEYAAYALSACQLRNPTGSGSKYAASVEVFPFAFIWRAMLELDGKISSEELNRFIFHVRNESELHAAISEIQKARANGTTEQSGSEVITGDRKNDRIVPWISLASFGYLLIEDKREGYYHLRTSTRAVVEHAAGISREHRDFETVAEYISYVVGQAGIPPVVT